jgi:hypothetical protein
MKRRIGPPRQVSQPSHHFRTVTLLYKREQVSHRTEEWRQFASMEKYHAVKIVIANEARCESRRREETGQKPEKGRPATFESSAPHLQIHRLDSTAFAGEGRQLSARLAEGPLRPDELWATACH